MLTIKLDAGRDENGNPQRVYVVFNDNGTIAHAVEEGYGGSGALREHANRNGYEPSVYILTFATTQAEYSALTNGTDNDTETED